MNEAEDLRVRLARLDLAASLDSVESRPAPELLERVMSTNLSPTSPQLARRRWLPIAAAAALAAAGVTTALVLSAHSTKPTPGPSTTMSLQLKPTGPSLSSCIIFSVEILKGMSPAFVGTVTSVDPSHVVLRVDHWYAGGTEDQVSLTSADPSTSPSLEGGVVFEVGKRYFVTAAEGIVNGCGYSGEATPQMQSYFEQAFGKA